MQVVIFNITHKDDIYLNILLTKAKSPDIGRGIFRVLSKRGDYLWFRMKIIVCFYFIPFGMFSFCDYNIPYRYTFVNILFENISQKMLILSLPLGKLSQKVTDRV